MEVIVIFYCLFFFFVMIRRPPRSTRTDTLFPYTTLFRSDIISSGIQPPSLKIKPCIIAEIAGGIGEKRSGPCELQLADAVARGPHDKKSGPVDRQIGRARRHLQEPLLGDQRLRPRQDTDRKSTRLHSRH